MKTIEITRQSSPWSPEFGYGDAMIVYEGTNIIANFSCSSCPNPYKPSDKTPWQDAYALIDYGQYKGQVVNHTKYNKCIIINEGGSVPTVNSNKKHNGEKWAMGIFIHKGGGENERYWRGSMGCITLDPIEYDKFIDLFNVGEKVIIQLMHC